MIPTEYQSRPLTPEEEAALLAQQDAVPAAPAPVPVGGLMGAAGAAPPPQQAAEPAYVAPPPPTAMDAGAALGMGGYEGDPAIVYDQQQAAAPASGLGGVQTTVPQQYTAAPAPDPTRPTGMLVGADAAPAPMRVGADAAPTPSASGYYGGLRSSEFADSMTPGRTRQSVLYPAADAPYRGAAEFNGAETARPRLGATTTTMPSGRSGRAGSDTASPDYRAAQPGRYERGYQGPGRYADQLGVETLRVAADTRAAADRSGVPNYREPYVGIPNYRVPWGEGDVVPKGRTPEKIMAEADAAYGRPWAERNLLEEMGSAGLGALDWARDNLITPPDNNVGRLAAISERSPRDPNAAPPGAPAQEPNVIDSLIAGAPGAWDAISQRLITQPDPRYAPKDAPEKTMGPPNLGPTAQEATPATSGNPLTDLINRWNIDLTGGQTPVSALANLTTNGEKPNLTQTPKTIPETSPWSMEQRYATPPTYVTDREPIVGQPAAGPTFQGPPTGDGVMGLINAAAAPVVNEVQRRATEAGFNPGAVIPGNAPATRPPTAAEYGTYGANRDKMRAAYGAPPLPAQTAPTAVADPKAAQELAGMTSEEIAARIKSGDKSGIHNTGGENGVFVYWAGDTPIGFNDPKTNTPVWRGSEVADVNDFWDEVVAAGGTRPVTGAAAAGGQSPPTSGTGSMPTGTPAGTGTQRTLQPTQSSPSTTSNGSSGGGGGGGGSTPRTSGGGYTPSGGGSTSTGSSRRSGSVEDMFGDDDDFGLNERDFTEKDYDGDGRISAKDRSVGRKRYQSELSKRRKKKGKTTSFSNVPQREDSPIRTKVLSAIDTSVNKKKSRR